MEILFRHAWILFIVVNIVNGFILNYRSKKHIAQNPELEAGYRQYLKGWLIYGNIPWVIMMIGNLSGLTHSIYEYFNPKTLNPMVLTFHLSIIVLWVLGVRWIFFKGGAEFIENHPGLWRKSSFNGSTDVTAKQVKLFFPLMLAGGIAGMVMMWTMDFTVPQF